MIGNVLAYDFMKEDYIKVNYDENGFCPLCSRALSPLVAVATVVGAYLYVVHICPNCAATFFAEYVYNREMDIYQQCKTYPKETPTTALSKEISELSPDFVNIFAQAEKAEENELTEICGLGYRRALEFLVKDYLINKSPELEEEIIKESLNSCIKNRISEQRIKTLAERSAWIGNDEAHYSRKHETLSYEDLKRFIHALITFIESELAFEAALSIEPKY